MSSGSDDERERKRPKTATDLIIQSALAEEQARKQAKKGINVDGPVKMPKQKEGKTFAEIEQEEGGPVKESLVGMAQIKRAAKRKKEDTEQKFADSTDVPDAVDEFEEKAEVEEEEGQKFTGFNLDEERETGYFDDDGNFVERKEAVDPADRDAWMTSEDSKVVSEEVLRKIQARRRAAEQESQARVAPLTDRQIAAHKAEMAAHMQAGETLAKALKRLGTGQQAQRAMGKREKQRQQQQQQQQQNQGNATAAAKGAGTDGDAAAIFSRITELADQLLVEGEVDVYDNTKEDFERFAAMWMPKQPQAGAAGGPGVTGQQTAAAAADEDEDMFAADGDDEPRPRDKGAGEAAPGQQPAAVTGVPSGAIQPGAGEQVMASASDPSSGLQGGVVGSGGGAGGAAAAATASGATGGEEEVDYSTWPVKELKRFLKERGVDPESFVEKGDMVSRVRELAVAGPSTAVGSTAQAPAYPVPLGYAYDPGSGYYLNTEVGMYFDASSGFYYNSGTWYTLDLATGGFVAMQV